MAWLEHLVDRLAERPALFHWLRKLPEANYGATRARIARVRDRLGDPRVLDAGCGTGEHATLFDPRRYLGVDLHPGYLGYARRRLPHHRFVRADLRCWQGLGERFDLVLVNGVLHHLDDAEAERVLSIAASQAAPGGTLLVIEDVTPGDAGLGARLVHALDHGDHIRDGDAWLRLVGSVLPIARSERYTSGICPYQLMECRAP